MASSLLLAVVVVLDMVAFALAVAAKQRRNTASLNKDSAGRNYCQYDSDIATNLGVGSFFILVASQVIIMVVTRCLCCGKAMRPSGSRSWAICLFITSWYCMIQGNIFHCCFVPASGFCEECLPHQLPRSHGRESTFMPDLEEGSVWSWSCFHYFQRHNLRPLLC
ncbi:uncharacterized protein LOC114375142 isoform X2 [Glycine soja]|uniref:uncharacterized protein isoform X2 n=1 Tax=Glycine max TaxID=3847 RepID=UPI0007192309|nr:uncharacterized protein LOC100792378 isoform X2 [Glycine max]XP_028188696.1 uncharacterized protein LOC114375142 isoform X2 [Glycine soja]|eukprot:XP_014621126.1 uncharacterized protein LOC100792378 isoform X2 [Glycine max]